MIQKLSTAVTKTAAACALAAAALVPVAANAAVIQLGFILDRSGSVADADWTIITSGLAAAVNTLIPVSGANTYEISVVTFSSAAAINIDSFLVTDAGGRATLAAQISGLNALGTSGGTNFAAAFTAMQLALTNGGIAATSYVNFATDGQQNQGGSGVTERNALITAGVDNISIEGIGAGVDANDLRNNFCYPQPCDSIDPFNFPAQGFYIGVANAAAYTAAIANKIAVVTGQVPEPGTLALVGAALGIAGVAGRKRATTAA